MTTPTPTPNDTPEIHASTADLTSIAVRTLVTIVLLVAALAVAGSRYQEQIVDFGDAFVGQFGAFGVAFGFFLPDAFTLPVPHDLVLALGVAGGLPDLSIIIAASIGSLVGGTTAFFIAKAVTHLPKVRQVLEQRAAPAKALMARYGITAVALGALTPLPYSLICYACGLLEMPFPKFFLISQLRILRVVIYLGLIHMGFVSAGI